MPYARINSLPESLQAHLPRHAQEACKEAFNNAWAQYDRPAERRDDASREETAHKVAWAGVKKRYHKGEEGDWHRD